MAINHLKNRITIAGFLAVVLAFGLVFIFYQRDLRCICVPYSKQFKRIDADDTPIFVSVDTSKETLEVLLKVYKHSKRKVEEFWSGFSNRATIIYCHNEKVYSKYGMKGVPALTRLGSYVILPSDGLYHEVISHELCHTELFARLGQNWWIYYQKLPCWFDEGLALQFNNTGMYQKSVLDTVSRWTIKKLRTIDRPRGFYRKDAKITLHHYLVAKKELELWLSDHSKSDFMKVIKSLREGGQFYNEYRH